MCLAKNCDNDYDGICLTCRDIAWGISYRAKKIMNNNGKIRDLALLSLKLEAMGIRFENKEIRLRCPIALIV